MNLYKLYTNPTKLIGHEHANDVVPEMCLQLAHKGGKLNSVQLQTLANSAKCAFYYARDVVRGRFPEGEAVIAKDPINAFYYTRDVVKGPWPPGEEAIGTTAYLAYSYAMDILKRRRFPKGEAAIAKDPDYAASYAATCVKGRFLEGEEEMKKDPSIWHNYLLYIKTLQQ